MQVSCRETITMQSVDTNKLFHIADGPKKPETMLGMILVLTLMCWTEYAVIVLPNSLWPLYSSSLQSDGSLAGLKLTFLVGTRQIHYLLYDQFRRSVSNYLMKGILQRLNYGTPLARTPELIMSLQLKSAVL